MDISNLPTDLTQRKDAFVAYFNEFSNWEDRYKCLIDLGKELEAMPEQNRIEENKVRGCQSQVWLFAELKEGKLFFQADSDASIAKGIVALLVNIYNNATPDAILALPPNFIEELGLSQHLSMSRANGLASMLKQIQIYAMAFQTKIKLGLA